MPAAFQRLEFHLPKLLALVAVTELMVYRLLVPVLRPRGDIAPPIWHMVLTYLGLFLFYFASVLAIGVIAHHLKQLFVRRAEKSGWALWPFVAIALLFCALSIWSIVTLPSSGVTFLLEGCFVIATILIVGRQVIEKGDLGIRFGLLMIALPLVVHFYAPLSVRYIGGEEALWNGLTDEVESMGRWLVILAALSMPYCFGARPFFLRAARIPPMFASILVGIMGALVVRHDYLKAMELAERGLGISFGPGAPSSLVALCLLGLAAVAWTLTNTLLAPTESRRKVGIGLALILLGGYAFAWPLQYLLGIAGLLTIADAQRGLSEEEDLRTTPTVPAIEDSVWQEFLQSTVQRLRSRSGEDADNLEKGAVITIAGEKGQSRSHFVFTQDEIKVKVTVERVVGAIVGLDVRCGEGDTRGAALWSLHSKRPSRMGIIHPGPPTCDGPVWSHKTNDALERYRIRDSVSLSEVLLDESTISELHQRVRGWLAIWPEGTLRFQVYPGRGAPMDRPIPITGLAFQTGEADPDDLLELLDFLIAISRRAADFEMSS